MFLNAQDLYNTLNQPDIDVITSGGNINKLPLYINLAVGIAKSKIQHRYDPAQVFFDVQDFNIATQYTTGKTITDTGASAWDNSLTYSPGMYALVGTRIFKSSDKYMREWNINQTPLPDNLNMNPNNSPLYWDYVGDQYYSPNNLIMWTCDVLYDLTTTYTFDAVYDNNNARVLFTDGKIYKNIQTGTGMIPGTDVTYWQLVASNYQLFNCVKDSIGNYPDNTTYFTTGDNRDPVIFYHTAIIAIHKFYHTVMPSLIPIWIEDEWEKSIKHLELIGNGKDMIELPTYPPMNDRGDLHGENFRAYSEDMQRKWIY